MKLKRNDFLKIALASLIAGWVAPIFFTASIFDIYACAGNGRSNCPALNAAHWKVQIETLLLFAIWGIFIVSLAAYIYKCIAKKT